VDTTATSRTSQRIGTLYSSPLHPAAAHIVRSLARHPELARLPEGFGPPRPQPSSPTNEYQLRDGFSRGLVSNAPPGSAQSRASQIIHWGVRIGIVAAGNLSTKCMASKLSALTASCLKYATVPWPHSRESTRWVNQSICRSPSWIAEQVRFGKE